MNARQKLNVAYWNGSLLLAGAVGRIEAEFREKERELLKGVLPTDKGG